SPSAGSRIFDEERDALAASNAGRGDAVAALRAPQFERECEAEANARGAQRVADGDSAAVDVHLAFIQPDFVDAGEDLRTKSLVDFDAPDLVQPHACDLEDSADSGRGTDAHDPGWQADRRAGQYPGKRQVAVVSCISRRCNEHRRGTVDDGRRVAPGLYATK